MREELAQEYRRGIQLLKQITEPLSYDTHLYASGPVVQGGEQAFSLPDPCPIVEKSLATGVSFLVQDKQNHTLCSDCSRQAECPITTAVFSPVFSQTRSNLVLVAVPGETDGSSWFRNHLQEVAEYNYVLCDLLSDALGMTRVSRELQLLKKEISALLSLSREAVLVLNPDGVILEANQPMCHVLGKSRLQLLDREITELIPKKDWHRVRQRKDLDNTLITPLPDWQKKDCVWKVRVKSVYDSGKLSTILLLVHEEKAPTKRNPQLPHRAMYRFDDVKGTSSAIRSVKEMAKRIAPSETTIMIRGESGTGKEVFAQAIHDASRRREGPFVAINCAAIPESLLESELFGYEEGAFTGARGSGKAGRFELAHGGTLFLDEIGDMSLHLQAKLLRVVQDRKVERIGGTQAIEVDVRLIAATHRNLEKMVAEETFREDLYYRLNVIPLTIPPLRERKDDIPILVEYFMKKISEDLIRTPKRLSTQVMERLLHYDWPGNIRELENVVEHFVQLEIGDLITLHSLPQQLRSANTDTSTAAKPRASRRGSEAQEKEAIVRLLDQYGRDTEGKRTVAEKLHMSLPTLYRRMKKWRIK
ncbi:sigma 54-interacting transcriptional regulator [Brevibacillus humidisoli]|uniref:sigma-54 interaction domain-containing protein n=1 Tax=Brevibacillus humidisoli TaxID=2895522 RepID=UPI001E3BE3A8|nr:sigma 54-interacting transcriptional regulator [Brevibacillus humidisoli]UFJ40764.1 sigma 54-interacting transcriptional regulator [Brevibacillus humidisoli]